MIVYLVLLIAVFSWASGLFTQSQDQIPYSEVIKLFRNQQVKSFEVDGNVITKCDSSSAKFQAEESGIVDVVADEATILEKVRELVRSRGKELVYD